MATKLEITLTRSLIGTKPTQLIARDYPYRISIPQPVEHQDNVAIRGMVKKVAHLVTTKEI